MSDSALTWMMNDPYCVVAMAVVAISECIALAVYCWKKWHTEGMQELVRCKDCKYYKDGFCYNPNTYDDGKQGETLCQIGSALMEKGGEEGMKKEYIVELREEEADELMDEHWVSELVRCKNCTHYNKPHSGCCEKEIPHGYAETWFCADGERR